jgi:predicted nucleic acid-binding protein
MITGEQRPGNETAQVAGLATMIDSKQIITVTSTITRVEVLECNLTEQQATVMKRLLRPPKIQIKDSTVPVMDLAHEIRDYYQVLRKKKSTNLPTIETPDAIHLATAIIYECGWFFTFDERDRTGSRAKRALMPLSGNVAGKHKIVICKPDIDQLGLNL